LRTPKKPQDSPGSSSPATKEKSKQSAEAKVSSYKNKPRYQTRLHNEDTTTIPGAKRKEKTAEKTT